jgi:hypothetical protein
LVNKRTFLVLLALLLFVLGLGVFLRQGGEEKNPGVAPAGIQTSGPSGEEIRGDAMDSTGRLVPIDENDAVDRKKRSAVKSYDIPVQPSAARDKNLIDKIVDPVPGRPADPADRTEGIIPKEESFRATKGVISEREPGWFQFPTTGADYNSELEELSNMDYDDDQDGRVGLRRRSSSRYSQ